MEGRGRALAFEVYFHPLLFTHLIITQMKHIYELFHFLVWTYFFYYHLIDFLTSYTLGEEKGELESHLRPVTKNRNIVSTLVKEFQASSILWEMEETSVTSMWLSYLLNRSK